MITTPELLRILNTSKHRMMVGIATFLFCNLTFANPVLDNVAAGQVSVQQTQTTTTVNQTSQKAIINWQSFNIAAPETTHFQQPAGGVALNRINPAQGPSQIYGRLTATGQIILVNPAGFFFGPSSFVNVGGIIASTANISNEDFLNGYYHFANSSGYNGAIVNKGQIIAADHGLIALIGGAVSNEGLIQANTGYVALASGETFTLTFVGNHLVGFAVDSGIKNRAVDHNGHLLADGVSNAGQIYADGGQILITAKSAAGVLDNVINMRGVAQAKSVYTKKGKIIISSDPNAGKVKVSGKLVASGKNNGENGGDITITGYNILLDNTAYLDVSGDAGGGNINIGGNYQGKGPLPNANAVAMESGATILADALTNGNGGNVILWSDYFTNARGSISAQGGSESGNGGFIETSGKQYLDVNGIEINLHADAGLSGQWLLDPADLTISTGTDTNISASSPFIPITTSPSILNVTTLTNALLSGDVTVQTGGDAFSGSGDITVANDIIWNSIYALTLNAYNNIIINAAIEAIIGSLNLSAGSSTDTITTSSLGTVDVKNFNLQRGNWTQVGSLPAFNVSNDFQIDSGNMPSSNATFIRASGGDGSPGSPYVITDIYGLQGIGSNSTTLAQNYQLDNDLDLQPAASWNSGAGFNPIGDNSVAFGADFNGNGYTISNLTINRSTEQRVGLFGKTFITASIYDFDMINPVISGRTSVGAVVGLSNGDISNITIESGSITGATTGFSRFSYGGIAGDHYNGTLLNLTVNNMTISGDSYVGGIAGYVEDAIMTNLANRGTTVTGGDYALGGIIGEVWGGIGTNLTNTGTVGDANNYGSAIGGVIGDTYSSGSTTTVISDAWNTGDVLTNSGDDVGGITGYLNDSTITNSYNTGNVVGLSTVGGIAGSADQGTITNAYNTGDIRFVNGESGGISGKVYQTTIDKVYNTGSVTNDGSDLTTVAIGGIVGYTQPSVSITNAYNSGYIDGTLSGASADEVGGIAGSISNSSNTLGNLINTGYIVGTTKTGAIAGEYVSGTPPTYTGNIYWNTETSGTLAGVSNHNSSEVVGKTTAEMKQQATYSGFDFSGVWNILENTSYPILRTFYPDISTARVISGTSSASGGTSIGLAYNGSEIATASTGNDGSFYFFEGNNALSGATVIPDGSSLLIYFADSSNDANTIFNAPSSYGSVTDATLAINSLSITGGTASNSSLASLISGLAASDLLFSLSGNNLTLGTTASPNANLVVSASTTYDVNGNISSYNSTSGNDATFNGPVTVSNDAVINLGTGDVTMANNVDGAQALEITTSGNIVISGVIGDTTPLTSVAVNGGGNTTINAARITTTGSQTYSNAITFGANTVMTVGSGAYLGFTGGASGAAQTLTLAGSGSNTFTMNGGNYNFAAINVNGNGSSNTLTANTGADQTWNISGSNTGSIAAMKLAFSGIQNLTGTTSNNTFIFANGASLGGTIDGLSTSKTNTINFSSYTTPIRIALNTTYNGLVRNSNGNTIVNFQNMTNSINNTTANQSSIALPTGKAGSLNITAGMVGYINDPFYFTNFQSFTGASGYNNSLTLNSTAIITSNSGNLITALIDGVTMTFINFSLNTSGSSFTVPTSDVASIVNSPTTNEEQNNNYSSVQYYNSGTATGHSVLNQTYTNALLETTTVQTGEACGISNNNL